MREKGFFSSVNQKLRRNKLGEILVQQGRLSPEQLHEVLKIHRKTGRTTGQVIQDLKYANALQIRGALCEQAFYRAMVACLTIFIGFASFGVSSAKANPASGQSQYQQAMTHKAAFGSRSFEATPDVLHSYPRLFGSNEISSSDISAFTKWTDVLKKLKNVRFSDSKLERFQGLSLNGKVTAVNEYVNQFKYIEDKDNFGRSDYWATPDQFFARGGDCEDFAIAKYTILKQLGVSESRMRLAIVHDKIKNIPHAILIVYTDNGPMVLDNQIKTTKQASRVTRYKPIYSINSSGWWRHVT